MYSDRPKKENSRKFLLSLELLDFHHAADIEGSHPPCWDREVEFEKFSNSWNSGIAGVLLQFSNVEVGKSLWLGC